MQTQSQTDALTLVAVGAQERVVEAVAVEPDQAVAAADLAAGVFVVGLFELEVSKN